VNNIFKRMHNILNSCCVTKSEACFNGKIPQISEDLLAVPTTTYLKE
jgi:hypothetical protein